MDEIVYIVRCLDFYKIGMTTDLNKRIAQMKTGNPFNIEPILVIRTKDARADESYLHYLFEHKRYNGEWFSLTSDDFTFLSQKDLDIEYIANPDALLGIEREIEIYNKSDLAAKEYRGIEKEIKATELEIDAIVAYFEFHFDLYTLSDSGKAKLGRLVKKWGLENVKKGILKSYDSYYKGKEYEENWHKGFNKLPSIISNIVNGTGEQSQELKDYYYLCGILANRFGDRYKRTMAANYKKYLDDGFDFKQLQEHAKICQNWTQFKLYINQQIEIFLDGNQG